MQAPTLNRITQTAHGTSKAVDHSAKPDPIVYAPEDATFDSYQQRGSGKNDAGNALRIRGKSGLHQFGHLEESYVKAGDTIKRGQPIAKMGHSGYTVPAGAAGAHLHYWIQTAKGYVYPPTLYNEPFIKGETMSKPDINTLRIAHSEIGGWDLHKTHNGEYDQLFKDAAGHLEVNDFIYKQWVAGGKFREARERAFREVKNLERIVGTLESTNTELQKALGIKDKEIKRLTARLAAKGDDKEVSVLAALKVLVQAVKDAWFNK